MDIYTTKRAAILSAMHRRTNDSKKIVLHSHHELVGDFQGCPSQMQLKLARQAPEQTSRLKNKPDATSATIRVDVTKKNTARTQHLDHEIPLCSIVHATDLVASKPGVNAGILRRRQRARKSCTLYSPTRPGMNTIAVAEAVSQTTRTTNLRIKLAMYANELTLRRKHRLSMGPHWLFAMRKFFRTGRTLRRGSWKWHHARIFGTQGLGRRDAYTHLCALSGAA